MDINWKRKVISYYACVKGVHLVVENQWENSDWYLLYKYPEEVYYHSEKLEAKTEVKAKKEAAVFAEHLVQEKEGKK